MSRNSKGHKLSKRKQAMQEMRTKGNTGASATNPTHGKDRNKRWCTANNGSPSNREMYYRRDEATIAGVRNPFHKRG